MTTRPSNTLRQLLKLRRVFDGKSSTQKACLLNTLAKSQLESANQVGDLHELLCFARVYPDDRKIYNIAERMLDDFSKRPDLQRFQRELADTGISGTAIHYRFYWQTAVWLYRRWPKSIFVDWREWEGAHALDELWAMILPYPATESLETTHLSSKELIRLVKRDDETDAGYLIRSLLRLRVDDMIREKYYDDLDIPLILTPERNTPSRTHSRQKPSIPVYGFAPLPKKNPDFRVLNKKPKSVEIAGARQGGRLVDLARVQMITHGRDLYAFMHADPGDVCIFNYEHGMQFVCYGLKPERRSLLEAMYIFLIQRNGVPIGYTQAAALFRSAEINFNVFDTFRGIEASRIFLYTLAMTKFLLGSDAFIINTQQLGEGNEEAIQSGAFWFYHKHGFTPSDPRIKRLAKDELKRKKIEPGYRSNRTMLKQLAQSELHLFLGNPRKVLVTNLPVENIGLAAGRFMETKASENDPYGERWCIQQCAALLDYDLENLSPGEQIAWRRWGPVILNLPHISRWSQSTKHALADVVNAKGGRRESEFALRFDRHKQLQSALLALGRGKFARKLHE